ncbi:MAG: phage minor capsid protein, partial [Raoultibacter sp.]
MLDPDYIEQAGDMVAVIYTQIEAEMLDYLVAQLLDSEELTQRGFTALALLSQSHSNELRTIIERNKGGIAAAVYNTVEQALSSSDADDIKRLGSGEKIYPQQVDATVAGLSAILERDNLSMLDGAKDAFLRASSGAMTQVNTGAMTTERALHRAVRTLERDGIDIISYRNTKTGVQTVRNKVDVAVRRHIRTQIAQDGARMTMGRLEAADVALVEVSSHTGARPDHAAWQGRCYSLHGDVTIGGKRYSDLRTATGYGTVDGLLGANCRHSFGPYLHGMPRTYEQDPKHPSGLDNDEVYKLTQGQRARERKIRESKRELSGCLKSYEHASAEAKPSALSDVMGAKAKLARRQKGMRDYIDEANGRGKLPVLQRSPRREWAGDMPKVKVPKVSGRKVSDFLGGSAASKALKAKGMTKKVATDAIGEAMKKRGGSLKDFAA